MLSFLISDAMAEAPAAAGGEPGWTGLLFPFVLLAIFYFFLIRPQIKRQKEHKALVDSIQKGDEVQIEGGVLGRITEMGDEYAKLEIADGVVIKIRRGAVSAVLPKGSLKEI
ncbi:MAG: preprotein translocase subunit YajC [Chromatiales bacterium]|jgi:preprotein translocase subunit YajC